MMKKQYKTPSAAVQAIETCDIIAASIEILYAAEGSGDTLGYNNW